MLLLSDGPAGVNLVLVLVLPPAVHIAPGSLPKGLHSLDLSRNKIATVEGLRNLTKLRVLNLSYNRISHIGHGTFLQNTS
jgi:Leucine-rich repeat (LRR) protein